MKKESFTAYENAIRNLDRVFDEIRDELTPYEAEQIEQANTKLNAVWRRELDIIGAGPSA